MGATVNSGRTDFVRIVQGLGIGRAISAGDSETLRQSVRELLACEACTFRHVPIGLGKGRPKPAMFRPAEIKYQFQAALKVKFS